MNNILNKIKENKGVLIATGGIGVTIAGVVLMKKASLKCTKILEEHRESMETIEECIKEVDPSLYTEEDVENDRKIVNVQTTIKMVRNYALPATLTIIGGCTLVNGLVKIYKSNIHDDIIDTLIEGDQHE